MKAQYSLRIPSTLKDELERQAHQKGVSLNSLILNILWENQERRNKNNKALDEQ